MAKEAKNARAYEQEETNYEVASQWQLMLWKFKKHKLAMIALPILILLYLMAIFADFLSPALPDYRYTELKGFHPSVIHWRDENGKFCAPYIYGVKGEINQETWLREYVRGHQPEIPREVFRARGRIQAAGPV